MADESQEHEEETNQEEPLDLVETEEDDEADELEVDESDEVDELEEVAEETVPEKGAYLVIGQGEFTTIMSNRGADDPGDNTLSAPQSVCKYGDMLFVSTRATTVCWSGTGFRRKTASVPASFWGRKILGTASRTGASLRP